MERQDIDQERVEYWRADYQSQPAYADYSEPLPGSRLKLDDDVMWLADFPTRVIWGTDDPTIFLGYCPDIFGDYVVPLQAEYIEDRAPVDPADVPAMPIYPESEGESEVPP